MKKLNIHSRDRLKHCLKTCFEFVNSFYFLLSCTTNITSANELIYPKKAVTKILKKGIINPYRKWKI